jgi:hypothetical protein
VTSNGTTVTYVHDGSSNLVDTFEYKIDDGHGATARATVQVRICASSDATCNGFDDDCDGSIDEDGAAPGEALDLVFPVDPLRATLIWSAPAGPGGAPVLFDVIRAASPADFVTGAVCVESGDGGDTMATDAAEPSEGGMFAYVVRAGNACGSGSAGLRSDGAPRTVRACP